MSLAYRAGYRRRMATANLAHALTQAIQPPPRYVFEINGNASLIHTADETTLYDLVESLCGRNPLAAFPSVRRRLRDGGRVYIAAMPDSPVRAQYGARAGMTIIRTDS